MKNLHYLILLSLPLLFHACAKDIGTLNVTYFEATAVYGDLDEVRSQPINDTPREISNPGKIYISENLILRDSKSSQ